MSELLKLTTDLKSLRYPDNQGPYIEYPIGYTKSFEVNDPIPERYQRFYNTNQTSLDFPIRGGGLDFDISTQTFTIHNSFDKERIRKFMQDGPRGPAFIRKQVGLNLSNPKMETDTIFPSLSQATGVPTILENTRFYNLGVNTLAQVGVQGTGFHSVRHGVFPFNPFQKGYYDIVNRQNIDNDSSTNRLLILKQMKMGGLTNRNYSLDLRKNAAIIGASFNEGIWLQYLGGPDSTYGIGLTTIRRYENTDYKPERGIAAGLAARTYADIAGLKQSDPLSYKSISRFGFGNTAKLQNVSSNGYIVRVPTGQDPLNLAPLMYFENSQEPWKVGEYVDKQHEDIIKFCFEAIDLENPSNSTAVFFRAFLSGISDNHQATIGRIKYSGRAEEFLRYQGVNRTIGFSFKISPHSMQELQPLYMKLNYLISQLYPDYSLLGVMRGPMIRLTIGDYFYRLAGYLENINITIDDVPWEIYTDRDLDSVQLRQLPHVINVSCNFAPIQDFLPRRINNTIVDKSIPLVTTEGATKIGEISPNLDVPYIGEYDKSGNSFTKAEIYNTTAVISIPDPSLGDKEINDNFYGDMQPRISVPDPIDDIRAPRVYDSAEGRRVSRKTKTNITETERNLLSQLDTDVQ